MRGGNHHPIAQSVAYICLKGSNTEKGGEHSFEGSCLIYLLYWEITTVIHCVIVLHTVHRMQLCNRDTADPSGGYLSNITQYRPEDCCVFRCIWMEDLHVPIDPAILHPTVLCFQNLSFSWWDWGVCPLTGYGNHLQLTLQECTWV